MGAAQFLPAIHPELPEVLIAEKPRPPVTAEERPRVPLARICIAAIGGAQRAVEVPVRTADDLPVPRLVEISAQHHRVHIAAEHLQHVEINRGLHIEISAVTGGGVLPLRAVERAVKVTEERLKVFPLRAPLWQ